MPQKHQEQNFIRSIPIPMTVDIDVINVQMYTTTSSQSLVRGIRGNGSISSIIRKS